MKLTLVVTAHHERYLTESLLSVAAQTSKDFHLICCADISFGTKAYECYEEILPYIQCQSKQILPLKGNGTAGKIRNTGFSAANTEWIGYLDGDDLLHINAIECVKTILENQKDSEVSIYSSGMKRIHPDGSLEPMDDSLNYFPLLQIYTIDLDDLEYSRFFCQFQIIRKSAWEQYPYTEISTSEDIDFMLHQLLMGIFKKIPKYLYYYRYTPNSFSSKEFPPDGDIVTQRYKSGYYHKLLCERLEPYLLENFRVGHGLIDYMLL